MWYFLEKLGFLRNLWFQAKRLRTFLARVGKGLRRMEVLKRMTKVATRMSRKLQPTAKMFSVSTKP